MDYVQYGASGFRSELLAASAGFWDAGDFVPNPGPSRFTGDATDLGVEFWQGELDPNERIFLDGFESLPDDL